MKSVFENHRLCNFITIVGIIILLASINLSGCLNSQGGVDGASNTAGGGAALNYAGILVTNDTFFKAQLTQGSWNNPSPPWVAESTDTTLPTDGNTRIGKFYVFGPANVTTLKPVAITLTYDPAALPAGSDPSTLRLYTLVNDTWVVVDTAVDPVAKTVIVSTSKTAIYRLAVDGGAASLALGLTAPATDPSVADSTSLAWTLVDNTVDQTAMTYDCAVFTADIDSAVLSNLSISGLTAKKTTISAIARAAGTLSHGLVSGGAYFWGARARKGNSLGAWSRRAFTFVQGPAVASVMVCNLTDTSATVLWRTDADATGSKVFYAFDGLAPVANGTSAAEDGTLSNARVHAVNLNWAGESHGTVKFYISSTSAAMPGITTIEDNNGSMHSFNAGEAFVPPVAPEFIVMNTTGMADGTLVSCVLDGTGKSSFPYLATVSSDRILLVHSGTRWNDATSGRITEVLSTLKVSGIQIHSQTGSAAVAGTMDISDVNGVFTVGTTISPVTP